MDRKAGRWTGETLQYLLDILNGGSMRANLPNEFVKGACGRVIIGKLIEGLVKRVESVFLFRVSHKSEQKKYAGTYVLPVKT